MGKHNCCITNCKNNWRNSPHLKFHSLPEDPKVRSQSIKLIRNESLKVFSSNTKICGEHFPGGKRGSRNQLPSIFPWSKKPSKRREITKHDIPVKEKKSRSSGTDNIPIGNHEEPKTLEKEQEQNKQSSDIELSNEQSKEENTLFDFEGNEGGATDKGNTTEKEEENVVALKEKLKSSENDVEECKQQNS